MPSSRLKIRCHLPTLRLRWNVFRVSTRIVITALPPCQKAIGHKIKVLIFNYITVGRNNWTSKRELPIKNVNKNYAYCLTHIHFVLTKKNTFETYICIELMEKSEYYVSQFIRTYRPQRTVPDRIRYLTSLR
jgi:hypothetical protein